jgi:hypothetical protein
MADQYRRCCARRSARACSTGWSTTPPAVGCRSGSGPPAAAAPAAGSPQTATRTPGRLRRRPRRSTDGWSPGPPVPGPADDHLPPVDLGDFGLGRRAADPQQVTSPEGRAGSRERVARAAITRGLDLPARACNAFEVFSAFPFVRPTRVPPRVYVYLPLPQPPCCGVRHTGLHSQDHE